MQKILFTFFLLLFLQSAYAQTRSTEERYQEYGRVLRVKMQNAPFPHPDRKDGKNQSEQFYPADQHYQDSTVLVFVPHYFQANYRIDFVVHFHGWLTNTDSVLTQFQLIEQFVASRKNAILVIPELAKNAPDSFGGKLEQKGGFEGFMDELMEILAQEQIRSRFSQIGEVVLSGHSGGYKVISCILLRGASKRPLPVREVYVFDGLFGELEKYHLWIMYHGSRIRFLNIFTHRTVQESQILVAEMQNWQLNQVVRKNEDLTMTDLEKYNIVSIASNLDHYEVMHVQRHFYKFLVSSSNLKSIP